jgi:hypothetical protein
MKSLKLEGPKLTQPGKNPASNKPSNNRHTTISYNMSASSDVALKALTVHFFAKPAPKVTSPQLIHRKPSQFAAPTLRSTTLLGISKMKYVMKKTRRAIEKRSPTLKPSSWFIPAMRAAEICIVALVKKQASDAEGWTHVDTVDGADGIACAEDGNQAPVCLETIVRVRKSFAWFCKEHSRSPLQHFHLFRCQGSFHILLVVCYI